MTTYEDILKNVISVEDVRVTNFLEQSKILKKIFRHIQETKITCFFELFNGGMKIYVQDETCLALLTPARVVAHSKDATYLSFIDELTDTWKIEKKGKKFYVFQRQSLTWLQCPINIDLLIASFSGSVIKRTYATQKAIYNMETLVKFLIQ